MIQRLGQVMMYVNDQSAVLDFWTEKVGFVIRSEFDNGHGLRFFEIAPTKDAQTSLVLHNKELIAKMQPELNLGTPSLMFFSDRIEDLYAEFKSKGITTGPLVEMPHVGKVFNFADCENNYFAVREVD
jgi:lactoylglutathione lyase